MSAPNSIWTFVLSALAVWRLTHLFTAEDGPWDLMVRLRTALGSGFFGSLLDCFYCLSVWFSLPFAIWLGAGWAGSLLHWLALSGAACLLERFTAPREAQVPALQTFEGDLPCAVVKNVSQ